MEGRRPLLAEVQALVGPTARRLAAADDLRARRRPAGDGAGRAAAPLPGSGCTTRDVFAATVGGVRITEPAADLARRARGRLGGATGQRCRTGWWRSARSAWPASSAGCAACRGGWPRRPGSASGSRWCRPARGRRRTGRCAPVDGMRVVGVPDVDSALRVLDLAGDHADRPGAPDGSRRPAARAGLTRPQATATRSRGSNRRRAESHVRLDCGAASTDQSAVQPRPTGAAWRPTIARTRRIRLRATLACIAPGTALRDGLERILRGRTGALIVLGHDKVVESICTGGFTLDVPFTATGLRELAKMDGAIIVDRDVTRILRAAVHLMPDPSIPTEETGTRHRTADRVARQTGFPVISVSPVDADHRGCTSARPAHVLEDSAPDPVPRQPGAGRPSSATSSASTRCPAPCPRWRSRTWSPSATSPWSPSGWRWSPGSPARSRTTCSSSAPTAGCCPCSSRS